MINIYLPLFKRFYKLIKQFKDTENLPLFVYYWYVTRDDGASSDSVHQKADVGIQEILVDRLKLRNTQCIVSYFVRLD